MMRTVSPVFASFCSSCAFRRLVRRTILPYTGCCTRRSIETTTVFSILSLTTRPTRVLRDARLTAEPSCCCVSAILPYVLLLARVAPDFFRRMRRVFAPPALGSDADVPASAIPMIFSRSTVLSRAMSFLITRRRSGSSRVSVPARNLRRNLSSSSSAIRVLISASLSSRISLLLSISVRLLTSDESRLHSQLRARQRHCLFGNLRRHTLELEHHTARLHHRHPAFR